MHTSLAADGTESGPAFKITFPYEISTEDDPKGYYRLEANTLSYLKPMKENSAFIRLEGYSREVADHQVTVVNQESGAGVTFKVDKPLYDMAFWSCGTTLCPENSIWLSISPGQEEEWKAEYTLFINP